MTSPKKWPTVGRDQLDELVLFVCRLVGNPAELGATKLQKVFWFADREHLARHGKPITGIAYRRLPQGPYSKAIDQSLKRLERKKRLAERPGDRFGHTQRQFFALDAADVTAADASAVQVLAEATEIIKGMTASQISALSHSRLWEITKPGAIMPIERMIAGAPTSPSENARALLRIALEEAEEDEEADVSAAA